jgi:hypothetical protein
MIPVAFARARVDRASPSSGESCASGCAKAEDGAYASRTRAAHWQLLKSARRIRFLPHGQAHESFFVAESATTQTTTGTPLIPSIHGPGPTIGQQAWIADFDGGWRVLRVINSKQGHWSDPYLSKEEAMITLGETIDATRA